MAAAEFQQALSGWMRRHWVKTLGYFGYFIAILALVFFGQARSEHAEQSRQIGKIGVTIKNVEMYQQIVENHLQKQLASAEAEKNERQAQELRELLQLLKQTKLEK